LNVKKINKRLQKNGFAGFSVRETDDGLVLTGKSDDWNVIVNAGFCAAKKYGKTHVLNDCVFTGDDIPPIRAPKFTDKAIDGAAPDVLVIGGGVVGAATARELTRRKLDVLVVEKEYDLAIGASGRNDGCVHPGIDLLPGCEKRKYNLAGNRMFDRLAKELDIEFDRCGQTVVFDSKKLLPLAPLLKLYFKCMGLGNVKVLTEKKLHTFEPALRDNMKFGLFFPTGGVVCPYNLTIALGENAAQNGAKFSFETVVTGMETKDRKIIAVHTNRGTVYPKVVVNAAGVFSEEIAKMAGDRFFSIHPRKGTNTILDHKTVSMVRTSYSLISKLKEEGHSKGGGIIRTVDDNVLVGPDAFETYKKEDFTTEAKNVAAVFAKQGRATERLRQSDAITYFSGVRAATFEEDFIVEKGRKCKNIVHAAGIQSPGLTAAPAIAVALAKMSGEILTAQGKKPEVNKDFDPHRKAIPRLAKLPDAERAALIKENPAYGEIVCRCEEISRGEIIDALHRPIPCATVDGVKKRCRPGMGRCQGGFCGPQVAKIISEELQIPLEQVKKAGEGSELLFGKTKGGADNG
jgi:glycerol-3-phosphate dehydrogenase